MKFEKLMRPKISGALLSQVLNPALIFVCVTWLFPIFQWKEWRSHVGAASAWPTFVGEYRQAFLSQSAQRGDQRKRHSNLYLWHDYRTF